MCTLQEQLKNLRKDLDTAHEELRNIREKDESLESNRYQLESKLRDREIDVQRLQLQLTNSETEKQVRHACESRIGRLSGLEPIPFRSGFKLKNQFQNRPIADSYSDSDSKYQQVLLCRRLYRLSGRLGIGHCTGPIPKDR